MIRSHSTFAMMDAAAMLALRSSPLRAGQDEDDPTREEG